MAFVLVYHLNEQAIYSLLVVHVVLDDLTFSVGLFADSVDIVHDLTELLLDVNAAVANILPAPRQERHNLNGSTIVI